MDLIFKYRKNFYNLSQTENVLDLSEINSTKDLIVVKPMGIPPHIFYHEYNDTHYQWCGPLIFIVECFAKLTKSR